MYRYLRLFRDKAAAVEAACTEFCKKLWKNDVNINNRYYLSVGFRERRLKWLYEVSK